MKGWEGCKQWTTEDLRERLEDVMFHRRWSLAKGESTQFYDEQIKSIEDLERGEGFKWQL